MTFEIWTEKYRPKTLDAVKGQEKVVSSLKAFAKSGNLPHLLFAGMHGTGKTTCFLAFARDFYGESWRDNVLELNASDERGIAVVRNEIKDFARTKSIGDVPFKMIFLDEADALTREAQQALRRTMEDYTRTVRFCLSCNYSSRIIPPIQSRCAVFRFKPLPKEVVLELVTEIAKKESLTVSDDAKEFIYLASEGDLRKAENILQSCAATATNITLKEVESVVSFAEPEEIATVISAALSGNFNASKNAISNVLIKYGLSGMDAIRQIQRYLWSAENIDEKLKVKLIRACGEYEFRLVEGANEFVQLNSLIAEFVMLGNDGKQ